ncbi:DUF2523 domain-containing protein [Arsukibacterium indicum]|uniref:DUF2523 domain-containing protein n=1 Tax=Arsukibacterium indicum TaxID=2848612 RepID=A0ABS6MM43_9GAMM|nr:DUF2523 domain-containing protein [Arsukibacterium indicum]MBV2129871.1 DUF2523 domain-containing protein [Arsukibacterium indicum]
MPITPWNPPLNPAPPIPTPKGVGIGSLLTHGLKAFRLSIVGFILTFIGFALVPLIIKVMSGLGIGFVVYELGTMALQVIFTQIQTHFSGLPPEILQFVSMAKIPDAISILFGGLAARLAFMGFSNLSTTGKQKSMIWQA